MDFAVLSTLEPRISLIWQGRHNTDRDQRALDIAHNRLSNFNNILENQRFFIEYFSVADIALVTVLSVANKLRLLENYKSLNIYYRTCEARAARRNSVESYRQRLGLTHASGA